MVCAVRSSLFSLLLAIEDRLDILRYIGISYNKPFYQGHQ